MISSAHIFYIPISLFIGLLAGFYLGRHAAQDEARELRKRRERRQALRDKQQAREAESAGDMDEGEDDPEEDDAAKSA